MSWSSVIGQNRVKELLKKTLRSNLIPHAFLFYGPEGIGKDALAIEFAKCLLCESKNDEACDECNNCSRVALLNHPNLNLIFALPTGKNEEKGDDPFEKLTESQITEIREQIALKAKNPYHKIEINKANFIKINSIRSIKKEAALSQTEIGRKIFIILNADAMNPDSSNSLLKTLEEPLSNTYIILTTSAKDQLYPTIISRCQLIKCDLLTEDEISNVLIERYNIEKNNAMDVAQLSNNNLCEAQRLSSIDIKAERDEIVKYLKYVLQIYKTELIEKIEELSALDRFSIQNWLRLLQSWLREALLLQQKAKNPLLDNNSQKMESLVAKFVKADFVESQKLIEKAIVQIDKNIYLPLVLTKLSIDLKKSIIGISTE